MSHIKSIFKKATIRGIADYLLFGIPPQNETRDYDTRLDEAYKEFEKSVCQYDKDGVMNLLDFANDMENEVARVYLEVGIQTGCLLAREIMGNTEVEKQENISNIDYQKMYKLLFKDVTCALEILQLSKDKNVNMASEMLKNGQRRTEKIFVEWE